LALSDLKAFERRLTEVIASLQPATTRWRMLLGLMSICTAIGAWHWLTDPNTSAVSFTQSLYNHPFFTMASIILGRYGGTDSLCILYKLIWQLHFGNHFPVILFMMGVHRRVIAPSIITQRARSVLGDFNMSCDDTGKLILKPTRPPHPHET
ncbi:NEPR1 protein, partial [Acromyrmex charruanus]